MKKSYREIANRINGFELPFIGGGVSWNPPTLEIEAARRLLTFLEDRRALYNPYEAETARYVVRSILAIRDRLTQDLEQLDHSSQLAQWIRGMRAACRDFLDKVEHLNADDMPPLYAHQHHWGNDVQDFFIALGELRATIGIHAALIAARYGIDVEEELVSIFPPAPQED